MTDNNSTNPLVIIDTAIHTMREAGISHCEIGHILIKAGTTHLEEWLRCRGLLRYLPEQIDAAHRYLGKRLAQAQQDKLMETSRGTAAPH